MYQGDLKPIPYDQMAEQYGPAPTSEYPQQSPLEKMWAEGKRMWDEGEIGGTAQAKSKKKRRAGAMSQPSAPDPLQLGGSRGNPYLDQLIGMLTRGGFLRRQ